MVSVSLHTTLLDDVRRTRAFDRALAETVRPGDVVADLGCGSGILSFLALKHGASRVYAVDRGRILGVARLLARENGLEGRMVFLKGKSQDVRLPERVDVVVSEMLGHLPFEEDLLPLLEDARRRFLKPGGRIIPESVEVWGAPVARPRSRRWPYGVRLETLASLAAHEWSLIERVRPRGAPRRLWRGRPGRARHPVELRGRWTVESADGVALWFDARLSRSVRLSSRGGTHWRPAYFPAREKIRGRLAFELRLPGPEEAQWRFNGMPPQSPLLAEAFARAAARR